jgi:hypothetical protein
MQREKLDKCPTSFRCVPVDPPQAGDVIRFFEPSNGGGFGEPLQLGAGGKKSLCLVGGCEIAEPHNHVSEQEALLMRMLKLNKELWPRTSHDDMESSRKAMEHNLQASVAQGRDPYDYLKWRHSSCDSSTDSETQ